MKGRLFMLLLLLGALGAGGFLLHRHWFPSEETRIKRLLEQAAQAASAPPETSLLTKLSSVNRLLSLCTEDIEIIVSGPGLQSRTIRGLDQLKEVMSAVQATQEGLEISLRDLVIELPPDTSQAAAQFIAQARLGRSEEPIYQEFRITLLRRDGAWKIRRVEPLQALGLHPRDD